jgi:hypothetical protein
MLLEALPVIRRPSLRIGENPIPISRQTTDLDSMA